MTEQKHIVAKGTMSNLVGMYAFIWSGDTLSRRFFIKGKADDSIFIVQAIGALDGEPNVCQLFHISDMMNWTYYPDKSIADECYEDYCVNKTNRYKL